MAKDFKIQKAQGVCTHSGKPIEPGEEFIALAKLGDEEIVREDYCLAAWETLDRQPIEADPNLLGVWRTRMPNKEEKKKLLVDDALLVNFFERLEGQDAEDRVAFRFVLALILMRKRLLKYVRSCRQDDGTEVWSMQLRGADRICEVVNPQLDEDRIAEVSQSLGDIMEGDFE